MSPSTRRSRRIVWVLIAAPILVLCSPFLLTPQHLLAEDFRDYFGPHAQLAREEFQRSGELPRWNPRQYAGVPFVGTGQNNFYYPPSWLFLCLPIDRAFGILVALHLLLAAAGTYRLARSYRLRRDAALVAALAFGMSFNLVARCSAGHLPNFIAVCTAPALLVLLRRAVHRPDAARGAALAAGGALAILSGSPQILYQSALLCAALAGVELRGIRREGRTIVPAAGVLAGALAGALALSAVHLLPLFETALASNRGAGTADLVRPFHDFDLRHLVLLTVPRFFWQPASDPWLLHEKAAYLGLLPLLLAGLAFRSRTGPVLFFGSAGLAALLEALSGRLLAWLPWYGGFRIPERVLWVLVLCLAMLAGFGWQRLRENTGGNRRRTIALAVVAALWSVVLAAGFDARAGTLLFAASAAVSIAATAQASRWPYVAAAVAALDLGAAGLLQLRTGPVEAASPWYESSIGPERADWRVLDLQTYKAAPVARGFRLLRGYGHPVSPELSELYASAWQESVPTLDTLPGGSTLRDVTVLRDLNVRWIASGGAAGHPEWKAVAARPGVGTLYEDPGARPMAFLLDAPGTAALHRPGAHRIHLQVKAERAGTVAVSEAWAAGWRAESADRRPVRIDRYRNALMKMEVPAGESELRLVYAPASAETGGWITAGAVVGALLVGLARLRKRIFTVSRGLS